MKMCSCNLLTVGALVAGVAAIGMAGAAMTKQTHHHHRHHCHHRRGLHLCGCRLDPVKDMRHMADNIHGMVSDVVSHECGHLG